MSLELLVEIPQAVSQIIHLGDVANNLGLRAPTVFIMEGGIALVNGETGTLYRKYTLSDTKAKIVDCVYVPGIRSFILALMDHSIITVPEQSKNPNETVLERWPVAIRKLLVAGEQEVYVHCEGGAVCHVAIKDLKVKAPASGKATSVDSKLVDKSDFVAGNADYLAVVYSMKKATKATPTEQVLAIWKHSTPATGSSQWLDINNNLHIKQDLEACHILHVVAEEAQNSFSIMSQINKTTCNWIKYDYNGTKLFARSIAGLPTMVDAKGGVMWFYNAEQLSCWNPRYGTEIRSMDSPNINHSLPCMVGGGSDGLAMSLLVGNVVDSSHGPTNIYRKDLGHAAKFNKRSLFDNLGSLSASVTDENQGNQSKTIHALASLSEDYQSELLSVKSKYEKKRQLEAVVEPSSSNNKKLKKIDLTTSTPASVDFLQSLEHAQDFTDEDWDVTKVLIRNGTLTLHSNPSILKQVVQHTRLDVLVELVRFASDLTEQHVVQIIRYSMTLPTEIAGYKVYGATIMKVTDANKHVFNTVVEKKEVVVEVTEEVVVDKKGKKKSSKKEVAEKVVIVAAPSSSAATKLSISQLELLRAILEACSLRVATFASPLISEAVQPLDVQSSCLLLRIMAFSLNEICALKAMHDPSVTSKHVFPQFGDHEVKVMVTWMEAILDAHFTEISLQASSQESIRRALFNAIQAIKNVQESFEYVEEALSLCTQIERISSKKSDVSKPVLGLYQVETLRL